MARTSSLTAGDWSAAALRQIAEHGCDGVSVEALARRLGVTKGSFYWHFEDRPALIRAALADWTRAATGDLIGSVGALGEPVERLRGLFRAALTADAAGSVEPALAARSDDPAVGAAVRHVADLRQAFLETLFRQLGHDEAQARSAARLAHAAYLGHLHLARAGAGPHGQAEYLDQLLTTLTARPGPAARRRAR